jgi:hypothetical protein
MGVEPSLAADDSKRTSYSAGIRINPNAFASQIGMVSNKNDSGQASPTQEIGRLPSALARAVSEKEPVISLKADHTAVFTDVPKFDGFGDELVCRLSGSANWELSSFNSGAGWSVEFQNYRPALEVTKPECNLENTAWGILVLSQHAPYRLYATVGDPDSDTGIEYRRIAR